MIEPFFCGWYAASMPFSTDSPRLELSVLMPTHNRVEVLQRALHLWCRQPAVR